MRTFLAIFFLGCTPPVVATPSADPDASVESQSNENAPDADEGMVDTPFGAAMSKELATRLAREAEAIPAGQLHKSPPPDAARDRAIRGRFGERCQLERTCGALWGIDCQSAVDGPYFYVRPEPTGFHAIATCGGACMGGRCTSCPPKDEGWTCPTY